MSKPVNQQVKEAHMQRVLQALWQRGQATKAQLAEESGLSVVTVGALMREIVEVGAAAEAQQESPGYGRPAQVYRFCDSHRLVLTFTVQEKRGEDVLTTAVSDLRGEILWYSEAALGQDTLGAIVKAADEAVGRFPQIASMGVGIPGQAVEGKVAICDRPDLVDVELAALLRCRYHCQALVENDVNAAAYAYAARTRPREEDCTVVVYFPQQHPPGAGILLGSTLLRGMDGMSGEIKDFPISVDWKNPPHPFELVMCEVVRAITALLAPRHILLYREDADAGLLSRVMDEVWERYDMPVRPQVSVEPSPTVDYEQGIREMALAKALPWREKAM